MATHESANFVPLVPCFQQSVLGLDSFNKLLFFFASRFILFEKPEFAKKINIKEKSGMVFSEGQSVSRFLNRLNLNLNRCKMGLTLACFGNHDVSECRKKRLPSRKRSPRHQTPTLQLGKETVNKIAFPGALDHHEVDAKKQNKTGWPWCKRCKISFGEEAYDFDIVWSWP